MEKMEKKRLNGIEKIKRMNYKFEVEA